MSRKHKRHINKINFYNFLPKLTPGIPKLLEWARICLQKQHRTKLDIFFRRPKLELLRNRTNLLFTFVVIVWDFYEFIWLRDCRCDGICQLSDSHDCPRNLGKQWLFPPDDDREFLFRGNRHDPHRTGWADKLRGDVQGGLWQSRGVEAIDLRKDDSFDGTLWQLVDSRLGAGFEYRNDVSTLLAIGHKHRVQRRGCFLQQDFNRLKLIGRWLTSRGPLTNLHHFHWLRFVIQAGGIIAGGFVVTPLLLLIFVFFLLARGDRERGVGRGFDGRLSRVSGFGFLNIQKLKSHE